MTTSARIGYGVAFAIGDGGDPETFTDVAEVTSVTPPSLSMDTVAATHTDSEEGWREYIAGLLDAGEVTIELNFVPGGASTTALLTKLSSRAAGNFRITFPDLTAWEFAGFCTGFEPAAPVEDKMSATATFKLTGKPGFIA